jgi:hypothetical protein
MERPSVWLILVILLATLLFLREPRVQKYDEIFLRWLIENSPLSSSGPLPLTVVDIGGDKSFGSDEPNQAAPLVGGAYKKTSPLEFALFLQAALEFKPTVIAFQRVIQWRDQEKDQAQIFIDQAMRVPKLVVGAELTANPDLDAPPPEIQGFTQVTGKRGELPAFSGISRQPDEDVRLISTLGFINLPEEVADGLRAPLLFQYRGEVIPSFALQTALLWWRIPASEVKVDVGTFISLPNGRKIPIRADGSALINPNAFKRARRISLNELLLAAQQRERKTATASTFADIRDQVVLARTPGDAGGKPDIFATTIATIQGDLFLRRVSWVFDCAFILMLVILAGFARRFSRIDLVLAAIAITAAYCLIALGLLSKWCIWLPGVLPLGAIWLIAIFCLFAPRRKDDPDLPTVAPPPLA